MDKPITTRKASPILFQGAMVRAILDGHKTQTRRIPAQPSDLFKNHGAIRQVADYCTGAPKHGLAYYWQDNGSWNSTPPIPKLHKVGDLLWVRESWSGDYVFSNTKPKERVSFSGEGAPFQRENIWYWADGETEFGDWETPRPSIHMPKWASRITLEVTDVRVQRLQDISENDAIAEGIEQVGTYANLPHYRDYLNGDDEGPHEPIDSFNSLWDSINAKRDEGKFSWDSNPWVVAYTFKPIFKNVDQVLLELANGET